MKGLREDRGKKLKEEVEGGVTGGPPVQRDCEGRGEEWGWKLHTPQDRRGMRQKRLKVRSGNGRVDLGRLFV
jgi:hypothetical protein